VSRVLEGNFACGYEYMRVIWEQRPGIVRCVLFGLFMCFHVVLNHELFGVTVPKNSILYVYCKAFISRMRWAGHVARMGRVETYTGILGGKPEGYTEL
jgi:hypothetical protein